MFTPTSTSTDHETGHTFVATMESPRYPFFATLFHPEKPFEPSKAGFYNETGVAYNRYFAQKLVEEARKSSYCRIGTPSGPLQMTRPIATEGSVIDEVRYYGKVHVYPPSQAAQQISPLQSKPKIDRCNNSNTFEVVDSLGRRQVRKGKLFVSWEFRGSFQGDLRLPKIH